MARKTRSVADRQKALQPFAPAAHFTLAGVRSMSEAIGAKAVSCTINGHCRTQVFEFPRVDFRPNEEEPHHEVYTSQSVRACVVSDLVGYFTGAARSRHYTISPSLRHEVSQTDQECRSQQGDRVPVFLVIEEFHELTPVEMSNGECNTLAEVVVRDGKKIPMLVGGTDGREFITAWATADGAWPEVPNNQQLVNMILAGVRVAQETPDPIRKYIDQACLVTVDGRAVVMMRPTASARAQTATVMDANAYRTRASEIETALSAMERDVGTPHMALLINSMYSDEWKDDSYQRLQYLRLWQSLAEAGEACLDYQGNIRQDAVVLAGTKTLGELTAYRNDIAHWWTGTIDENFLADLQRTINELMRRRYF